MPIRALDYGSSLSDTTIRAALAAIGSNEETLIISAGIWVISADITLLSNVRLQLESAAMFELKDNVEMIIAGSFDAPLAQVFITRTGTVTFGQLIYKVFPQWWGAKGNGTGDDTFAFQKAINAAARSVLSITSSTTSQFKISGTLSINASMRIVGDGKAVILFDFPLNASDKALFRVTASHVAFDGLTIKATDLTHRPVNDTRYAILISGKLGERLQHVMVKNCKFIDLKFKECVERGLKVTHCIYNTQSDYFVAENNFFDSPSGAAIFISFSDHTSVRSNDIRNTGWYSIQYQQDCRYGWIHKNTITGDTPGIRDWGGSINLMSDGTGTPQIKHVDISENYISGVHSYATAIRVASGAYINIINNTIVDATMKEGMLTSIRVETRGVKQPIPDNKGSSHHITIVGNQLTAGKVIPDVSSHIGIYVDNQDHGVVEGVGGGEALTISNNRLLSPNDKHYFRHGIIIHGQQGGWNGITISGNHVEGRADNGSPVDGLIGLSALCGRPLTNVHITSNTVQSLGEAEKEKRKSSEIGIALGEYIRRVLVEHNIVQNFYVGIRTWSHVSEFTLGPNQIKDSVLRDLLFAKDGEPQNIYLF